VEFAGGIDPHGAPVDVAQEHRIAEGDRLRRRWLSRILFATLVFAFAVLSLRGLFELRPAPEDELVLRGGGRRRRTGALALVVFGRELINAPRTSSSDCWALTIKKAQPNATATNGVIRILDFILLPLKNKFQCLAEG